jgi:hypothetical protein
LQQRSPEDHIMAQPTRRTEPEAPREDARKADEPSRFGDVLGISDTPAEVDIPQATDDHGGNPAGIELGPAARRNLPRGKGATGIQMGDAGSGTDIEPARPRSTTSDPDA